MYGLSYGTDKRGSVMTWLPVLRVFMSSKLMTSLPASDSTARIAFSGSTFPLFLAASGSLDRIPCVAFRRDSKS